MQFVHGHCHHKKLDVCYNNAEEEWVYVTHYLQKYINKKLSKCERTSKVFFGQWDFKASFITFCGADQGGSLYVINKNTPKIKCLQLGLYIVAYCDHNSSKHVFHICPYHQFWCILPENAIDVRLRLRNHVKMYCMIIIKYELFTNLNIKLAINIY